MKKTNTGVELVILREKIRQGTDADNPALMSLWFSLDLPTPNASLDLVREHYFIQFQLMLDAISDDLVPQQWRNLCLDNIYRPLSALKKLSNTPQSERQLRSLYAELTVSCRYFQSALNS